MRNARPAHALCHLDEIDDPGSAGVMVGGDLVMLVRRGDQVFAYINSCPHVGVPLDFQPGRFLDVERRYIQCSSHGALFRIDDGFCLAGPCSGKSLALFAITLTDGWILPRIA